MAKLSYTIEKAVMPVFEEDLQLNHEEVADLATELDYCLVQMAEQMQKVIDVHNRVIDA